MEIPDEYQEIIEGLSKATDDERIRWTLEQFGLEFEVAGFKLVLDIGNDFERKVAYVTFALTEKSGKMLDIWRVDEGCPEYDFLYGLYLRARRKALGIPQRLERIRDELRKSNIIGEASPAAEKAGATS